MPIAVKNRWSIPPGGGDRTALVLGVDKPGPDNVGVLPNIARASTILNGNVTYSTAGQTIQNMDFYCRVSVTAANVTFKNCYFHGFNGPTGNFGLIQCTNANVLNLLLEDCTINADYPNYQWNGIVGHSFTARRCEITRTQDGIQINRSGQTWPFDTRVIVEQCWLHDFAWFTAATGGIVHPVDTETHNDLIQSFGGRGTIVRGNYFNARFARQTGHWMVTDPIHEPYTTVTLGSLPDGGPYQHIPDRDITEGTTTTESTGRYNYDDCAALMIGDELGATIELDVHDNWFAGGNYCINGGGNTNPGGGYNLGSFLRNRFTRDQGGLYSGGDPDGTQTINFQQGGWDSALVTVPTTGVDKNYYEDNGHSVTVRF
jgi:hypothetical protein